MESRSRTTSRRSSISQRTEPKKERDQSSTRAIFQRANRFLSCDREQTNDGPPAPMRYYERGHALPHNCSPERKATIPFRNPELGLPSYRRRHDTLNNEVMSGLSPLRCMTYSNFRRGDSQSRTSPRSCSPRSTKVSPHRQSQSSSYRRGSTSHLHASSHTSSKRSSRKCSPATRRASVVSKTHSPSRITASNRYTDSSSHSWKESPSQSSYGQHSLDSEKLYRNLQSIASSAESDPSQQGRNGWSKRSRSKIESDGRISRSSGCNSRRSRRNTGGNSRDFSPPGGEYNRSHLSSKGSGHISGYNSHNSGRNTGANSHDSSPPRRDYDQNGHSLTRNRKQNDYRGEKGTPLSKSPMSERHSRTNLSQSQGSWHETTHSPISPASPESSHSILPSKEVETTRTGNQTIERSRSTIRRGLEALILSENTRSKSQPPVPEMTIEDYVVIADIPKINLYPEEDEVVIVRRRPQSRSPRRDKQHSYRDDREGCDEYIEPEERGRGRERGRDRRDRERRRHDKDTGGSSETNSSVSRVTHALQRSREEKNSSDRHEGKQCDAPLMQLNFVDLKKGWMFMLDNCAEWRKFWFVLDGSGLRYYTSPDAEEMHGPDGEIDISCCLDVVEFEVDKNYGLQIHMRDAEITLSAMTSRIRRKWINILQRRIRSMVSPENARSEPTSPSHDEPDMMSLPLTNHREAGVGRDTEQEKRLGDRTKWFQEAASDRETDSPWDKVRLKKGAVAGVMPQVPDTVTGIDIEKKWEDFEKIPVGEIRSLSLIGSESPSGTNQGLENEASLTEVLRKGQAESGSALPCDPGSICAFRLEEMEREHMERLQEMERAHEEDMREIETQREQMLRKEAQRAAQAIQALKMARQKELERLKGAEESECPSLQQELDVLSECYTQRCVELTHLQNSARQRHRLKEERHREVEQLRKENQELQARLTEEMGLMRSFITGQRSGVVPVGSYEHSATELEKLLRVKENEIEYLHKKICSLRNEVQLLIKEKQDLSERCKAAYVELCEVKGLSDRDQLS